MGVAALIEPLKTLPDWRRGRKVQSPLWLLLLLSLLGVMSGYSIFDLIPVTSAMSQLNFKVTDF